MKLKLYRDKVISRVKGKDLVGVYIKLKEDELFNRSPAMDLLLAEMSPKKADAIIKLWNSKKNI